MKKITAKELGRLEASGAKVIRKPKIVPAPPPRPKPKPDRLPDVLDRMSDVVSGLAKQVEPKVVVKVKPRPLDQEIVVYRDEDGLVSSMQIKDESGETSGALVVERDSQYRVIRLFVKQDQE